MMQLFHVLSRGVDKRDIFLNDRDYYRFIHNLFEFNNQENINNNFYLFNNYNDFVSHYNKPKRKLLVDIHAFCLMKNHYHLLLSPRMEKGVTKFMRKLNIGYSKYFNIKHERTGALFEGRYKCILIKDEAHFIHLPYYIHLNPLDFKFPEWRIRKLRNYKAAMDFLNSYKWSSHPDYLGEKNFPSVTNRKFLSNFFEEAGGYEKNISQWIKNLDLTNKKELLLE